MILLKYYRSELGSLFQLKKIPVECTFDGDFSCPFFNTMLMMILFALGFCTKPKSFALLFSFCFFECFLRHTGDDDGDSNGCYEANNEKGCLGW
jgi:hypothetical protein